MAVINIIAMLRGKLLRFNIYDACHMSYAEIKNISHITFPPSNLGMKSVVFIFTTRVHN